MTCIYKYTYINASLTELTKTIKMIPKSVIEISYKFTAICFLLSRYSSRVLTILSYAPFDKAGCKISDSFFTWPSDQGNSLFPGIGPKAILMKSFSHGLSMLRASTPSFSDRSPKAIYKSILMSHTSSNILQEVLLYIIPRPRDRT